MARVDDLVVREPYQLGPVGGRPALLLHGLTGSPWDLRPLAEGLAEEGWRVHAPRLTGHLDLESLASSHWGGWYRSAELALLRLHEQSEQRPALVVGFSMGSLLALRLAAKHPRWLLGLIAMAVPIEQAPWQVHGAALMARLHRRSPLMARLIGHRTKLRSDVRVQAVADRQAALPATPYSAVVELTTLQAEIRGLLPLIRTPTLLLHGAFDHIAPIEGSARVSQALGAARVHRVILHRSYHHLARDLDRERVRAEVLAYGAWLTGGAPGPTSS